MTADFSPQNPQSEPGQRSPSPSFIFFDLIPANVKLQLTLCSSIALLEGNSNFQQELSKNMAKVWAHDIMGHLVSLQGSVRSQNTSTIVCLIPCLQVVTGVQY